MSPDLPEIVSVLADREAVDACGDTVGHDYRPHHVAAAGRTYDRCVWCHVIACGLRHPSSERPCVHPFHHLGDHADRLGTRWSRYTFPKQGTP